MISSAAFNARVAAAARQQPLGGLVESTAPSTVRHKWKVRVRSAVAAENGFGFNPLTGDRYFSSSVFQTAATPRTRLYQVFVGDGCVNQEPAAIEYRTTGDPRGWLMPEGYFPRRLVERIMGPGYGFVDRPLWEDPRPFLLLTAPDGADLGGFVRTPDLRRPEFFRTEAMWEKELYHASVMVSISPFRADPTETAIRVGGQRPLRWRVTAGKFPNRLGLGGAVTMATQELARIYLTRERGDPATDRVYVQQLCYWNLRARASINHPLLELISASAQAAAAFDLGLLALGLTGATVATAMVGLQAATIKLLLDNLEDIVAATSGVHFWDE